MKTCSPLDGQNAPTGALVGADSLWPV